MKYQKMKKIKMKGNALYLSFLAIVGVTALVCGASPALSATSPTLGTAQSYGILGAETVTNTGPSVVHGNLGVSPGTAVTGFPPGKVTGTIYSADTEAGQAQIDVTAAYNDLEGQNCDFGPFGPTDLAGKRLVPGVYCYSSSLSNTGKLILDAGANNNAVWVFKIKSTLFTGPESSIVFKNGGQNCNVFWQVGSSVTLDTNTKFIGNILALTSISLNTGAKVAGRALARNGAVTMDTNKINPSFCEGTEALTLKQKASPEMYDQVDQKITYSYKIKNTGNVVLDGPFTVLDNKADVTCPATPYGLYPKTYIICSAIYKVTQDDLIAGSITNTATAYGNSVTSNQDQVTVTKTNSQIPEFPNVALPVIAVIGLVYMFQRRKGV